MDKVRARVIVNKRNNQLLIHLSRKKLQLLKQRNPRYLNIKKEDLEF